ncbi:hypothetical protein ABZP36_032279 [Zizania latifolia]
MIGENRQHCKGMYCHLTRYGGGASRLKNVNHIVRAEDISVSESFRPSSPRRPVLLHPLRTLGLLLKLLKGELEWSIRLEVLNVFTHLISFNKTTVPLLQL